MYNPYLPQSRQFPEAGPPPPTADAAPREKKGLSALLAGLKLEELDTGDVLLLLILLFLFLDDREDNLELLITLGLMLLL
ncbi:hypothetical protein [Vermiculatibacterium agrestimuris]|uniref:hypothetical protein n=1 Tax=Vermiculatibacterium agrestimuris TaxID=2941519 RepID=UPI0020421227|nr:hypothetical protein [Vermiculatibacterium agrestimuris]